MVAVPYGEQLEQRFLDLDRAYTLKPQRLLAGICARTGVPLLDLFPAFLRSRDRRLFKDEVHLTPAGHEVAASELVAFLQRERLVPRR